MINKNLLDISLRYLILVLVAIPNLYIFYKIFTPLTIYPIYFFFKIFFETTLSGTTIFVKHFSIQIISSCVAGSAYYLLFVLNLSVPNIKFSKRIKMISFAFATFLIVNLIRIIILSFLSFSNMELFDITHNITWYMLSVLLVVGIWFVEVKTFKIKEIPFYTDIKNVLKLYDN
jgi:exosortase/archaeosortase family protein